MKLSDLLIEYRTRMNLSQREFSRQCDLSNTYISFLEKEKNPRTGKPMIPTIEQYKKLADGMGISVQRLFELLDNDAPVDLHLSGSTSKSIPDEFQPKNDDVRLLVRGFNQFTPDEIDQAKAMMKIMFAKHAKYFEEEKSDDT